MEKSVKIEEKWDFWQKSEIFKNDIFQIFLNNFFLTQKQTIDNDLNKIINTYKSMFTDPK